jgi:tRNA pseudouridine38-40 synthase
VRGIAGGLRDVGTHRRSVDWFFEALNAEDRSLAAPTAPARGLTLVEVVY